MSKSRVAIVMGSDSDLETMKQACDRLREFGIAFDVQVLSAHRTPDLVSQFAKQAKAQGISVIIAGAGGAAHLAGVVAAHTTLPVIGVPIGTTSLGGLDSLLSTVQMPAGVPVATVAIGPGGAANAAILAVQILALHDQELATKLEAHKRKLTQSIAKKNAALKQQLAASPP